MISDISGLDLNLLPVLDVLLEERSVTRAARRLHLTQSTVSGMLARLRDALEDPLFVRESHGIVPTPRAEEMIPPLKEWLATTRALVEPAAFDPASWSGTISLAATDYTHHVLLAPLLGQLRERAPKLRLAIHPLAISTIAEEMARGRFDLAISTADYLPRELSSVRLMKERFVLAMGTSHPLAKKPRVTLNEFCRFEHIVVSPSGGAFSGPVDEELAARGRERRVRVSVPSFSLVPELLRSSDLLCFTPGRIVRDREGVHVARGPFAREAIEYRAVWQRRLDHDVPHRWFRGLLAEVARGI